MAYLFYIRCGPLQTQVRLSVVCIIACSAFDLFIPRTEVHIYHKGRWNVASHLSGDRLPRNTASYERQHSRNTRQKQVLNKATRFYLATGRCPSHYSHCFLAQHLRIPAGCVLFFQTAACDMSMRNKCCVCQSLPKLDSLVGLLGEYKRLRPMVRFRLTSYCPH